MTIFVLSFDLFGRCPKAYIEHVKSIEEYVTVFTDYVTYAAGEDYIGKLADVKVPTVSDAPLPYVPEIDARDQLDLVEGNDLLRAPHLAMDAATLLGLDESLGIEVDSSGYCKKGVTMVKDVLEVPVMSDVLDIPNLKKIFKKIHKYNVVILRGGSEISVKRSVTMIDKVVEAVGEENVVPMREFVEEYLSDDMVTTGRVKFLPDGIMTEAEEAVVRAVSQVWALNSEYVRQTDDDKLLIAHLSTESVRNLDRLAPFCAKMIEEFGREYEKDLEMVVKSKYFVKPLKKIRKRLKSKLDKLEVDLDSSPEEKVKVNRQYKLIKKILKKKEDPLKAIYYVGKFVEEV